MTDDQRIMIAAKSDQELALTEFAFDQLKLAFINEMIGTEIGDADRRERIHFALRSLGMIRQTLMDAVKAGNDAKVVKAHAAQFAEGAEVPV